MQHRFLFVFLLVAVAAVTTSAQMQTAMAHEGPATLGGKSLDPAPQALTEGERCSVDSLAQRATIVALRAEVAKLHARIAELEAPLVAQAVATERQQLEQRFRDRLKPPAGSTFDWQTLTFTAPPPATAPPK